MSAIEFRLVIDETISPFLHDIINRLDDRAGLHAAIAGRLERLTRDHLTGIAPQRHDTANRLGASPTRILSRAASGVVGRGTADGAEVSITPGSPFARAFGDVEIRPLEGRRMLTIPAHKDSYGKSAGEFDNLVVVPLGQKKIPALIRPAANGDFDVMYWLVPVVRQKQDRTLLPSDDQLLEEAEAGAEDWILVGDV